MPAKSTPSTASLHPECRPDRRWCASRTRRPPGLPVGRVHHASAHLFNVDWTCRASVLFSARPPIRHRIRQQRRWQPKLPPLPQLHPPPSQCRPADAPTTQRPSARPRARPRPPRPPSMAPAESSGVGCGGRRCCCKRVASRRGRPTSTRRWRIVVALGPVSPAVRWAA
jgi:hypothetical protein